jgi:ABC-type branched-subunit amino acid transport system ATPase component/ABC-type branched-subunit amino acid transport system permease subunit
MSRLQTYLPHRLHSTPALRWVMVCIVSVLLVGACRSLEQGYATYLVKLAGINIIVVYGLNLLMGYAGQAFIAAGATFAIGAYVAAVAVTQGWVSFPLAWLLAGAAAGLFGVIASLPALRLGGAYLAMVSIAFNVVVEQILIHSPDVMGGAMGIPGIPPIEFAGRQFDDGATSATIVVTALVAAYCTTALRRSQWGLALVAMRESEVASQSLGIRILPLKASVFFISSAIIGLAGALYSPAMGYISPDIATVFASVTYVLMLIVGGSGTTFGPLLGALLLTALPQLLVEFQQYHLIILGIILLVFVVFLPQGIASLLGTRLIRWRKTPADENSPAPANDEVLKIAGQKLIVRGLRKSFGGVHALQGADLTAERGSIQGLIGPNGSGKSTLVNVISGFYSPDEGQILREDQDVTRQPTAWLACRGLVRTFQTPHLFGKLTVRENLRAAQFHSLRPSLFAALFDLPISSRINRLSERRAAGIARLVGLEAVLDHQTETLSQGDRRRVEIARALAAGPRILILDEPAVGLSAEEIEALRRLLQMLRAMGLTMVLIEHHMDIVMKLCDRITVLERGAVIAEGTPDDIQRNSQVRRAYLGATRAFRQDKVTADNAAEMGG